MRRVYAGTVQYEEVECAAAVFRYTMSECSKRDDDAARGPALVAPPPATQAPAARSPAASRRTGPRRCSPAQRVYIGPRGSSFQNILEVSSSGRVSTMVSVHAYFTASSRCLSVVVFGRHNGFKWRWKGNC